MNLSHSRPKMRANVEK